MASVLNIFFIGKTISRKEKHSSIDDCHLPYIPTVSASGTMFYHMPNLWDVTWYTGSQIKVRNWKLFFLFLNQNICCGYSKEPSRWDGSFEHPKHMFKLMDKKIIAILSKLFLLNWPYAVQQLHPNILFYSPSDPSGYFDQPGHLTVRSVSLLSTHWHTYIAKGFWLFHAHSKNSDQTGWKPRLIWDYSEHSSFLLVLSSIVLTQIIFKIIFKILD